MLHPRIYFGVQARAIRILIMARLNLAVVLVLLPAGTVTVLRRGDSGPLVKVTEQTASRVP